MPGPRFRAAWVLLVLAAAALAGCLDGDGEGPAPFELVEGSADDRTRDSDQYWMVWVHGTEVQTEPPRAACTPEFDHEVDPDARTVEYDQAKYDFDPDRVRVLVAFDHIQDEGCPVAQRLVADPSGAVIQEMSDYGDLSLEVQANGSVLADGVEIPLGRAAEASYEGERTNGTFRIDPYGAWDTSGLSACC